MSVAYQQEVWVRDTVSQEGDMQRNAATALVAAAALGITSCGGSARTSSGVSATNDSGHTRPTTTSAPTTSSSTRDFTGDVEAICKLLEHRLVALREAVRGRLHTPADQVALGRKVMVARNSSVASLDALTPPATIQERFDAYRTSEKRRLGTFEQLIASLGTPQAATLNEVANGEVERTRRLAAAAGIRRCPR